MNQQVLFNELNESNSLNNIQEYIKNVIDLRGFSNQSVQSSLLLLLEETGELAKAVRKTTDGLSIDLNKIDNGDTVESEIADVFIVLVSICNKLNINLFDAMVAKEKINCTRQWSVNNKQ